DSACSTWWMCRSPRSRWGRAPRCWRVGWICGCWRFTGRATSRARAMRWSRADPSLVELVQVLLCSGEFGLVEDRDPVLEQQLRGHPGAGILGAGESTVVVFVQAAGGTGLLEDGHPRSEEHTSELQSRFDLVCRLLLEKKKKKTNLS